VGHQKEAGMGAGAGHEFHSPWSCLDLRCGYSGGGHPPPLHPHSPLLESKSLQNIPFAYTSLPQLHMWRSHPYPSCLLHVHGTHAMAIAHTSIRSTRMWPQAGFGASASSFIPQPTRDGREVKYIHHHHCGYKKPLPPLAVHGEIAQAGSSAARERLFQGRAGQAWSSE
jgi:hypothetical protein